MASILIIDDEAPIRGLLRHLLEADGHQIRDAANGHLGLQRYREAPADLVITDILMPERDGLEVLLALTRECLETRVIVMTGATGEPHLLDVAKRLGAHQVMAKPFTQEELRRVVRVTLEPERQEAEEQDVIRQARQHRADAIPGQQQDLLE